MLIFFAHDYLTTADNVSNHVRAFRNKLRKDHDKIVSRTGFKSVNILTAPMSPSHAFSSMIKPFGPDGPYIGGGVTFKGVGLGIDAEATLKLNSSPERTIGNCSATGEGGDVKERRVKFDAITVIDATVGFKGMKNLIPTLDPADGNMGTVTFVITGSCCCGDLEADVKVETTGKVKSQ